ncbi:MAG TPA: ATP-binding protein [Ktedonobacteraceae bacterium]|nr:ATP-binding protein [Ktedonobacteraceae bacterium]
MRFTVRSLGEKLVICAALMLLLCILLFSVTSWYVLKSFYEREAISDANRHIKSIQSAYQTKIDAMKEGLITEASKPVIVAALTTSRPTSQTSKEFASTKQKYHFSSVSIISLQGAILGDINPFRNNSLIIQAQNGETVSTLQMTELEMATPVTNSAGANIGALVATQDIDDFVSDLSQIASDQAGNKGLNVALCESNHIVGTTLNKIDTLDQHVSARDLCTPGIHTIDGSERYLTKSDHVLSQNQSYNSPSLTVVDIEPLYNLTAHTERALLIMIGLAIFIIALGVTTYTLIARTFFVRPIHELQSKVAALVAVNGDSQPATSTSDELSMLSRSFSLLSESLSTQENESDVITRQMSDLLAMSDVLISTLNLEALLGEIVSRLGHIMQTKGVALLLYGREMQSPWAVARWSNQQNPTGSISVVDSSSQNGAVTVHMDPTGDITMTATTKMAAIAVPAKRSDQTPSGKRSAIRVPKLTSQSEQVEMRAPRIPRPALRELDMILARMSMQKQKIACGEDIEMIYQGRGEAWARMALEAGYYSVIAVPLLLQDQVIGAIVLYGDRPYQVSRRDTFLLSTAAIQAAMAIQNTLLFAEVKDKNAALERVNHLKSQFLATVTHELRTPLHSIISYGALILEGFVEGELTAEQEEHIQFIVRRAEDLSRLVDDMLDLSKIEADRLEVKIEPLVLKTSLTEVINQLKPIASNKGLQLTLEMDDALPMVLADSQRIRQVVINMISNALKFTEKGGVTIQCALLDRYDMLRISVNDTGIGISPASLDYIFAAFRQADGSTTRRFGGTGLGLTIARKLIELQGGEVSVESVVGQGSTFAFTLPVASAAMVQV